MSAELLHIQDLAVEFQTPEGTARAVDGITFSLGKGETLGLVGESGCGKSVTSLSILGLVPRPPGRITRGEINFNGQDLRKLKEDQLRRVRGRDIAMIFQEPMTALNPVLTIGRQVAEPLMAHQGLSRPEAHKEALAWLEKVQIPAARMRLNDYPHQLSGGMRQRVMIAMAMVCHPRLLIADEPTTALDVTIQAQILALMAELKAALAMAILLITHDLGVIAQNATRVLVMYAGEIIEEASTDTLFEDPRHPYTRGLMRSIPRLDSPGKQPLKEISGTVPPLTERIAGCKFAARCPQAFEICRRAHPELMGDNPGHRTRCWLIRYPRRRRPHG